MGRQTAQRDDSVDIPSRILDEATRLFARHGFDGASVQAIADAVGIRKPSLLYHYPSKDALRRAVLERMLGHWNDVLPTLMLAATSGGRRFDSLLGEVTSFFTEDVDRARLLLREMLDRPDEMRALMTGYLHPWMQILADYIRRGQGEGTVHDEVDPESYVLHVVNLVVAAVAVQDVLGVLVADGDTPGAARLQPELLRITRTALFKTRPSSQALASDG